MLTIVLLVSFPCHLRDPVSCLTYYGSSVDWTYSIEEVSINLDNVRLQWNYCRGRYR